LPWKTRTARIALLVVLTVAAVAATVPTVTAQGAQPPAGPVAEPPITEAPLPPVAQDGFVPVRPGELEQEQLPAAPLVFAAYSVIWLALVVYIFLLWRRLTVVERDLRDVTTKLQARRP
jgi:CcmD family protein